jgi:hypothetical protein
MQIGVRIAAHSSTISVKMSAKTALRSEEGAGSCGARNKALLRKFGCRNSALACPSHSFTRGTETEESDMAVACSMHSGDRERDQYVSSCCRKARGKIPVKSSKHGQGCNIKMDIEQVSARVGNGFQFHRMTG